MQITYLVRRQRLGSRVLRVTVLVEGMQRRQQRVHAARVSGKLSKLLARVHEAAAGVAEGQQQTAVGHVALSAACDLVVELRGRRLTLDRLRGDGVEDGDRHEPVPNGGPEVLDDEVLGHAVRNARLPLVTVC